MSRSVRRGVVLAAAVSGLLALGAGAASADQQPAGTAAAWAVGNVTDTGDATAATAATGVQKAATGVPKTAADGPKAMHRAPVPLLDQAATAAPRSTERRPARLLDEATRQARKTGAGVREGAGKASSNVTQEAGEAVSEASSAPADTDLGAVSRIPAQAAPSSAPGLPEDLVIEVPEVVPGVPSIGVIPFSLPALPVTPGVPSL
ncbi:hypothetical protein HCC61_06585 [Streptomyces sp. HNM0575]|uniref:hypothetical protein n=1 Tax=Streptomyces sp. HNM0575 TaxID=2716338 RepID=UPI00145CD08C|nr:hypothetical protein [Streptomyces sp. HNM0575]NLU72349.1 hypothetical protein [Streptomyces sp. HNM0575]